MYKNQNKMLKIEHIRINLNENLRYSDVQSKFYYLLRNLYSRFLYAKGKNTDK